MNRRIFRIAVSIIGAGAVTFIANAVFSVNASTAGFAYLLYVLVIASTWGFPEAAAASIVSTLALNFFFLPPVGTFTVEDPQNWVALFTFFVTSLIASRLSTEARRRSAEAVARQRDLERLYTFGRAILLIDANDGFAKRLCGYLAETFQMSAVALFDPRTQQIYRAGPLEFEGMDSQLQEAALKGVAFADPERNRVITAIRLGAQPIAALALQGEPMQDSVLQSIANLVAIGLERERAQELAQSVEVTRRSERLRTTLLDAMAHELKTPLTPIRAATSALLAATDDKLSNKKEILRIADEEAARLEELIDNALDMAHLDSEHIDVKPEPADLIEAVREVVVSMDSRSGDHRLRLSPGENLPAVPFDRRLVKLAVKQLLDNALKYSSSGFPVEIRAVRSDDGVALEITDHGPGIPASEQGRIFERFYRSTSVEGLVPGSGLGLSIAHRIVQAHGGDLAVKSRPGETTFRLVLPMERKEQK
jgi:two-component system, OmpR family, sensor histidine kinase KdpD